MLVVALILPAASALHATLPAIRATIPSSRMVAFHVRMASYAEDRLADDIKREARSMSSSPEDRLIESINREARTLSAARAAQVPSNGPTPHAPSEKAGGVHID